MTKSLALKYHYSGDKKNFGKVVHSNAHAIAQSGNNIGTTAFVPSASFSDRSAYRQGMYVSGYGRSHLSNGIADPILSRKSGYQKERRTHFPQRGSLSSTRMPGAVPRTTFREPPAKGYTPFS